MKNMVYGFHVVYQLLLHKSGYILKLYIVNKNNKKIKYLVKLALSKNIKIYYLTRDTINNYCSSRFRHQGILAYIKNIDFSISERKFFSLITNIKKFFILILSKINNPYNLGACIRTAVAAGVNLIILSKYHSVSLMNHIVQSVSTGSIYQIKFYIVVNISYVLRILRTQYFYIIGTCTQSLINLYKYSFNLIKMKLLVLILGNEEKGMQKNHKNICHVIIKIPLKKGINSLNVSVANGIIIYELLRLQLLNN